MRFNVLAAAFAFLTVNAFAVYYGQTRAEVIKELGKPTSALVRGQREVLMYPKGARIELEDGKVAIVQNLAVTDGPVAAPAAVETPAPAPVETPKETAPPTKAETKAALAEAKVAKPAEKSPEADLIAQDAAARVKMEKAIEEMENPEPHEAPEAGPPRWLTFAVELIVKALMMLAALKLTTKYWSVEISWAGLAIAAAADTVTRAAVGAVALWALGMGTTMYADEATAAIILVVVLRKVSYNQSLSQAVTITLTSKTFSIVVGSFLSVFVLRTLFGGGGGLMPF